MARNYMQDITPSDNSDSGDFGEASPVRSIRSIRPSASRARLTPRPPEPREEIAHRPDLPPYIHEQHEKKRSWVIWVIVGVVALVLAGVALLFAFASTSVSVVPRVQTVTFDQSSPFTAYPSGSAATGTIPYTTMTETFEETTVVEASGVENAEEKATGNVTIYNYYSDKPVALIKNTRFQTPDGLIFRIPASIDVPGKKGNTPGTLEVTVFADQNGPSYNVGPFDKLTIPGLKSTAEMYEGVYAKSTSAFSGGFAGQRPAVTAAVLDSAKAEIRNRLNQKARDLTRTVNGVAFPDLVTIRFETIAPTQESGGVRIGERAVISVPVFPGDLLAQSIGQAVSASAEGQSISIRFSGDAVASPVQPLSAGLGQEPIVFTIGGRGQLVWNVDTNALAAALAGREEAAFETIIGGFPSIEEAHARVVPFWKSTFPTDPADIEVTVEAPAEF